MGVMLAANWPDKQSPNVGGKSFLIDSKLLTRGQRGRRKDDKSFHAERLSGKTLTICRKREFTPKNVDSGAIVQTRLSLILVGKEDN